MTTTEVVGAREAAADFARLSRKIDDDMEKVAVRFGRKLASVVASKVPHATGKLAGSLTTLVVADGASVGYDTSRAPYAGWIEFGGTRGRAYMAEGRYLYPTASQNDEAFAAQENRTLTETVRGFRWSKS